MTKKEKMQRLFDESGIAKQIRKLVMSREFSGIVGEYSNEITAKIHEINVRHVLNAAAEAYTEIFTAKEIDKLISIYQEPVIKKLQESSAYVMEAATQHLIDSSDQINQEIDEMIQREKKS